ncbi:hypothetical protein [Mycobacterium uberis]|nr:hypothetical protein [Mycobacterium uberis]
MRNWAAVDVVDERGLLIGAPRWESVRTEQNSPLAMTMSDTLT